MREPSGDQRAHLSWASELRVRLRVGPFSIGAVNTSPRATNRARSPFGLSSKSSICPAADTRAGRAATPSSGTQMGIGRDSPLSMANRCSSPFIS